MAKQINETLSEEFTRNCLCFFRVYSRWPKKFGTLLFSAANCQNRGSSQSSDAHVSWSWTHELSPPEPGAPQVTTEPSAKSAAKASRVA